MDKKRIIFIGFQSLISLSCLLMLIFNIFQLEDFYYVDPFDAHNIFPLIINILMFLLPLVIVGINLFRKVELTSELILKEAGVVVLLILLHDLAYILSHSFYLLFPEPYLYVLCGRFLNNVWIYWILWALAFILALGLTFVKFINIKIRQVAILTLLVLLLFEASHYGIAFLSSKYPPTKNLFVIFNNILMYVTILLIPIYSISLNSDKSKTFEYDD